MISRTLSYAVRQSCKDVNQTYRLRISLSETCEYQVWTVCHSATRCPLGY